MNTIAKAIIAGLSAALGSLAVVMADAGGDSLGNLTVTQWLTVAVVSLTAFGAAYGVPNAPTGKHAAPDEDAA